jgi:hypothetical protein
VWVGFPPPAWDLRRIVGGYLQDGLGNMPGVISGWRWPFRSIERLASSGEVTIRRPQRDRVVREVNLDLQRGGAKGSDADDRALKVRIRSSHYIVKRQATIEDHPVRSRAQRRNIACQPQMSIPNRDRQPARDGSDDKRQGHPSPCRWFTDDPNGTPTSLFYHQLALTTRSLSCSVSRGGRARECHGAIPRG